jgi:pyruvate dehydrogenase E1 component
MTDLRGEAASSAASDIPLEVLDRIQKRVLWLAVSMIHHANNVRQNASGIKVGGHQASSASMTSIMTALFFAHLDREDRVSVKPHAAPVLHAINYLLGRLDERYLTELRAYKGLQSYPSRSKDPDPVDFSTGSVGIGATATIWSALSHRYLSDHSDAAPVGRHVALVGDAELDEGAVWEALVDPMVPRVGELLWVVDVNRQSLDRVVPDIALGRIGSMFDAAGWQSITVKYGRRLRALFSMPGGEDLRTRLDAMSNEEYQRLLRSPPSEVREHLAGSGREAKVIRRVLGDLDDATVALVVRDLGGHDIGDLMESFRTADAASDRPSVVFAYTLKAWRLPTEGHPANHSALLSATQWEQLGVELGTDPKRPWARFDEDSPEATVCNGAARRLDRGAPIESQPLELPASVGRRHVSLASTQQAFGRFLVDVARSSPEVASRIVTVSPDVASSTNLGGWINQVGIWNTAERPDWFDGDPDTLVHWQESKVGQHIELGIAECNLVGLLGELGATWSRDGLPLLPIGTLYDPFVTRALEQWSFGIYAGGQSILVGTPSGVTLAPEGGAHQSIITPSIGVEQPGCVAWEPAFGQDLEWAMLAALSRLGRRGGESAYFRLSTRPLDQALADVPEEEDQRELRRRESLAGGYVLRRGSRAPDVTLAGVGVVMPEVLDAADDLVMEGVSVDVVCLTSPDLVFRALQARRGVQSGDDFILDVLFPVERSAPIVTVLDGHPHTLSFLSGIHGVQISCLGVNDFGQVGDVTDLYGHFGIDSSSIFDAAVDMLSTSTFAGRFRHG